MLAKEVVDIAGQIDGGEAQAARGEKLFVAGGGAASGGVWVERRDDSEASERREPFLFEPARADESDRRADRDG